MLITIPHGISRSQIVEAKETDNGTRSFIQHGLIAGFIDAGNVHFVGNNPDSGKNLIFHELETSQPSPYPHVDESGTGVSVPTADSSLTSDDVW